MKIVEIIYSPIVENLLERCSLPITDLERNDKVALFGAHDEEELIACIGLEIYDDTALLRSLAVASEYRKDGIGRKLTDYVETYAKQKKVAELYLLTETAEGYFNKLGYQRQARDTVPSSIQGTTQYSDLCPSSSTVMRKVL